eukprot:bmy_00545T0
MGGNMDIIVVLNITATNRLLQDEETGLPIPLPVGQMGTVRYVLASIPTTTASYIQMDFSPVVQQQKGNTIQLADAGEAEFPEDYAEGSSQLLLSATFLTAELALLQKSFDVNVQEMMIGELPPQTTETLARFIPEMAKANPKPKPLVTQIRINKPPKVTMKTGKSLLHLHGTLETFAPLLRGKAPVSLFLLEIEKALTGFITDFLQEAYIPAINDVLQAGLPLPDFLDTNYNLAELDIA